MAVVRTVSPRRLALQLLAGLLAVALLHPPGAFPEDFRVTVRASRALDPPPLPNRPLPGGRGGKECAASLRAEQRLARGAEPPAPHVPYSANLVKVARDARATRERWQARPRGFWR